VCQGPQKGFQPKGAPPVPQQQAGPGAQGQSQDSNTPQQASQLPEQFASVEDQSVGASATQNQNKPGAAPGLNETTMRKGGQKYNDYNNQKNAQEWANKKKNGGTYPPNSKYPHVPQAQAAEQQHFQSRARGRPGGSKQNRNNSGYRNEGYAQYDSQAQTQTQGSAFQGQGQGAGNQQQGQHGTYPQHGGQQEGWHASGYQHQNRFSGNKSNYHQPRVGLQTGAPQPWNSQFLGNNNQQQQGAQPSGGYSEQGMQACVFLVCTWICASMYLKGYVCV
jgi:hypothetical protein